MQSRYIEPRELAALRSACTPRTWLPLQITLGRHKRPKPALCCPKDREGGGRRHRRRNRALFAALAARRALSLGFSFSKAPGSPLDPANDLEARKNGLCAGRVEPARGQPPFFPQILRRSGIPPARDRGRPRRPSTYRHSNDGDLRACGLGDRGEGRRTAPALRLAPDYSLHSRMAKYCG